MNIGKIPNELLEKLVISKSGSNRPDVLTGPGIGQDCAIIDFGEYACVLSTDPITGAASRIGYLGVHISCNDIATTGAEPVGVLVTIMAPPSSNLDDIEKIMIDVNYAARELDISILGGHTEVTGSIEQMILSVTAVGKVKKEELVQPEKAQVGDDILVTKTVGLEGTAILAHDRFQELNQKYDRAFIEKAKRYINDISVVKEGKIAGRAGAHVMHDATEGGVLGAVWEMSRAMGKGVLIDPSRIPIAEETEAICQLFQIDPLRLISSGMMVIVSQNGSKLVEKLENSNIRATIIGKVVDEKGAWILEDGKKKNIEPPDTDELYKALEFDFDTQAEEWPKN